MPMTANLRISLWVLFGMALFVNYQIWMRDYPAECDRDASSEQRADDTARQHARRRAAPAGRRCRRRRRAG